ncbi:alpha/beta hydrolase family protein [Streptomyces sp. NPDC002659]|uniref:alpha/beta hydrolase family protein n=1 Tax=Streptomyces sp. NPDC002659 TaxID=3364656 RepID=UPI0036957570
MHEIVLLKHTSDGVHQQRIGQVRAGGFRLLPSPDPAVLAVGISSDNQGHSTLWRIVDTHPRVTEISRVAGLILGGQWLDDAGRFLAFNQPGRTHTAAMVLDLVQGAIAPLTPSSTSTGSSYLLLASRTSGRILLASGTSETLRLGWGTHASGKALCFPERLNMIDGTVAPLAIDNAGQRLALKVHRGAQSHLMVYEYDKDKVYEVKTPPGTLQGASTWTGDSLHVVYSAPTHPAGVATATFGKAVEWSTMSHRTPTRCWESAHLEQLDGPDGPIEAVVYGGRKWRESRDLLIALHGGPEAAWHLDFNPLFQYLAAAGIAVLAPNQRGSSGYGIACQEAIRGAWGGSDLDDISHIAQTLTDHRHRRGIVEPLMLFGASYGAYLALLAASSTPDLWSRCTVIAPFSSSRSLHEEGSAGVRSFLKRLDALGSEDKYGARDLRQLAPQIRARLLIIHGINDEVIPVSQSRHIRSALLDAGRREDVDFIYREPAAGHDPLSGPGGSGLHRQVTQFFANASG